MTSTPSFSPAVPVPHAVVTMARAMISAASISASSEPVNTAASTASAGLNAVSAAFSSSNLDASRIIGIAVTTGAALVKIPQIIKIAQAGSISGISLSSTALDLFTQCVAVYYNLLAHELGQNGSTSAHSSAFTAPTPSPAAVTIPALPVVSALPSPAAPITASTPDSPSILKTLHNLPIDKPTLSLQQDTLDMLRTANGKAPTSPVSPEGLKVDLSSKPIDFFLFGENVFLGLGNWFILLSFILFRRDPRASLSLLFPILLYPLYKFPRAQPLLAFLQSLSFFLNIVSKMPQIIINHNVIKVLRARLNKARVLITDYSYAIAQITQSQDPTSFGSPALSTSFSDPQQPAKPSAASVSQLSPVPFAMNFLGSLFRLYTTVSKFNSDKIMMSGFLSSLVLNGTIVYQCMQIKRLEQEYHQILPEFNRLRNHYSFLTTPSQRHE